MLNKYKHMIKIFAIILISFFISYITFIAPQSFLKRHQLKIAIQKTQESILSLQKDSVLYTDTIFKLNTDTAFIEFVARTQLGMAKKGETVYYLPPKKSE
jgi:cell division protein FtsB